MWLIYACHWKRSSHRCPTLHLITATPEASDPGGRNLPFKHLTPSVLEFGLEGILGWEQDLAGDGGILAEDGRGLSQGFEGCGTSAAIALVC